MMEAEIAIINDRLDDIEEQIKVARRNRSSQEQAWREEKIRTSELVKNKLRKASDEFLQQIESRQESELDALFKKRKELERLQEPR